MITVEALTCRRGRRRVLHAVTCAFHPGEVAVLLGPNGAGKTTLLECLAGHRAPDAGRVRIAGRSPEAWAPRELARRRAVMSQQSVLDFGFRVEEVVAFGRDPHGDAEHPTGRAIIDACLAEADAAHLRGRRYPALSGGERQRVQLARALAQIWDADTLADRLLLLDEPTASLDLAHQEQVLHHARTLARRGCCVVAVLHDLSLAGRHGDRFLLLDAGRVAAAGTRDTIFRPETLAPVYGCPISVHRLPPPAQVAVVPGIGTPPPAPGPPASPPGDAAGPAST